MADAASVPVSVTVSIPGFSAVVVGAAQAKGLGRLAVVYTVAPKTKVVVVPRPSALSLPKDTP